LVLPTALHQNLSQFVLNAPRRLTVWLTTYHHELSVGLFAGLILLTQVAKATSTQLQALHPLNAQDSEQATLILQRYFDPESLITTATPVTLASVAFASDNIGGQDQAPNDTTPITHTVTVHENIWTIAAKYDMTVDELISANPKLEKSHFLHIGDVLTIPAKEIFNHPVSTKADNAALKTAKVHAPGDPVFSVPVDFTYISQYFSLAHPAYDLPAPIGTDIVAAHDGCIISMTSGYAGGWGNSILEDVGDDFNARYAHMLTFAPGMQVGTCVTTGQVIGYVGVTGHTTGPHLHFEVRHNGAIYDPFDWKP